jgi:histone acetyltransferase MYST1
MPSNKNSNKKQRRTSTSSATAPDGPETTDREDPKEKQPTVDVSVDTAGTSDADATAGSTAVGIGGGGGSTTYSSTGRGKTPMDQHPYARGAVIEVLHGVSEDIDVEDNRFGTAAATVGKRKGGFSNPEDDDWWDADSDAEEEEEQRRQQKENENDELEGEESEAQMDTDDSAGEASGKENGGNDDKERQSNTKSKLKDGTSIRLCDIIDRIQIGDGKYRYYVHYRDFNRRMDEWVSMSRIVSPPSIGNAKARAIKKEEEKKKRQQQREEEKKKLEQEAFSISGPRSSRRRSTTSGPLPSSSSAAGDAGGFTSTHEMSTPIRGGAGAASSDGDGGSESAGGGRRRARRKTGVDADDATVVAGNAGEDTTNSNDGDHSISFHAPVMAAEKGIVALPTAAATKVGEHVVQTIAAKELDEHEGLDEASLREHEEVTKVKNVSFVELGPHMMETWYFSPLPKELLSEQGFIEVLHVCEFTFQMFARKSELRRFQARIPADRRHPPGNEIYRNGNLSMFEVDGFEERIYCQNLCYIAKLFLDHKTLYFDVDPFLFYVLCEVDNRGYHPVGYYSKEKYSDVGYNLACILTFPSHQRKGYGRFLIAFSYELSKKEERVGSPEKPMSDLGQQAYKPYWASTIVDFLLNVEPTAAQLSIMDISKKTSIMAEDIVFSLNQLGILKIINGVYFIAAEEGLLKTLAKKYPVKEPRVDASKLHWTPFITDVKRDKFSIHSKKASTAEVRGAGGF